MKRPGRRLRTGRAAAGPGAAPLSSRRRALRLAAALLLTATLEPLAAQPAAAPAARLRLAVDGNARRIEVGDPITVRLEVWVGTWFQAPVDFPATLDAGGALVEAVGGSPESRFEDFDGLRWTGLTRRYRVLPAQPGEVSVALTAPLQVVPGGGDGRPLPVAAPAPLRLMVQVPPGAEDIQPFVAARRLELSQRWSPDLAPDAAPTPPPARVGDLIRRDILLMTDSASPLLPAPDFGTPAGADVRLRAPETLASSAAGGATLARRHVAVYALQQPGRVLLPPVQFVWWDLNQRRRRVTRLDGLQIDVQPAAGRTDPFAATPAADAAGATTVAATATPGRAALLALLGAGTVAAVTLWRRRRIESAAARRSERQRWRQLRYACGRGDPSAAAAALREWLAVVDAPTLQRWRHDPAFARAVSELARHRFGPDAGGADWHGEALWQAVRRLRRDTARTPQPNALPTLHP